MVKLPEEEFLRQLNAALQERSHQSGWVNSVSSSLDLLITSLTGPAKQTALKPPLITGGHRTYRTVSCMPYLPIWGDIMFRKLYCGFGRGNLLSLIDC